jgi:hypothetical protein
LRNSSKLSARNAAPVTVYLKKPSEIYTGYRTTSFPILNSQKKIGFISCFFNNIEEYRYT